MPTLEERVAALEHKTQDIRRDVNDDGDYPYLQINARVGILTNFWSKKSIGQGAALSVGTANDRYAAYFEIDEESCPDYPSTAVFASCVPASVYGQDHIAFEGAAGNGRENYGLTLSMRDRTIRWRMEGIELLGAFPQFLIGRIGGFLKQLWP